MRPAIIEIRVADAEQAKKTKTFYEALLGTTQYPYRLAANMALMCEATDDGSALTIIYWEVAGSSARLREVYDDLIAHHGCKGLKEPHKPLQALEKGEMEVATLADAAGNVLGLVINPPYPFI